MMRSTMVISANNAIRNMQKADARYQKITNQIATGQKVNKPSDDPLAVTEGLRISTVTKRLEQYNRNIVSTGYSFLDLSYSALSSVSSQLTKAKTLVIQGASDTTTNEMRAANALEISSILHELVTIADRQEASRYLFGGTETLVTPYEIVGGSYVYYRGNDKAVNINVDVGATMQINMTGDEVFGALNSTLSTGDMSPRLNMNSAYATPLSALNGGTGVASGSINIKMGSLLEWYPNGITVDLTGCVDLHDVKTRIESETLKASEAIDPRNEFVPPQSYLKSRYVTVELNENGNGLSLRETDYVWEAVKDNRSRQPSNYPGFINSRDSTLTISEVAGGTTGAGLGILGSVRYSPDPLNIAQTIPQPIYGRDLDPIMTKTTLLADLQNYDDKPFTITNGALPTSNQIIEIDDSSNYFQNWYLNGLNQGQNTDYNGELYVRVEETETGSGQYRVNVYKNAKCTPEGMIASGNFAAGLIKLDEVNDSGVSGTVTMPPVSSATAVSPVTLQVNFPQTFSSSISLSAYQQETVDPSSRNSIYNFRMTGMSPGHDPQNRSTDNCGYNGEFFLEVVNNGTAQDPEMQVNVYNARNNPRSLIATGALENGIEKGEVDLFGVGNFSDLYGSVYVDWTTNLASETTQSAAESLFTFAGTGANMNTLLTALGSMTGTLASGMTDAGIFIGALDTIGYTVAAGYDDERLAMLDAFDKMSEAKRKEVIALANSALAGTADPQAVLDAFLQYEPATAYNMTATFATVEDLINKVNSSNTYTTADISANGMGLEITSHLAGAYLMITERVEHATHYNDYGQLGDINLTTVMTGYNTDDAGKIYSNIITALEAEKASGVGLPAQDLPIYSTTVNLYKDDPQTPAYSDEDSLVGFAKIQLAYNEADETWYQYEPVTAVWREVKLPATLNIDQTNHSGLTGTLELTSVRLPSPPADSTAYYDTQAAAGRKNLNRAIVIDTAREQYNNTISNSGSGKFSYLENTELKGVKIGVNTDADGNILVTTGYQVSTNALVNQVANLNFTNLDDADLDANKKLYAATSYAVFDFTSPLSDPANEPNVGSPAIQQINITKVGRNFDSNALSDTSKDGKIYVEYDGTDFLFYNSDPAIAGAIQVGVGTVSGDNVAITPVANPVPPGGVHLLEGSFKLGSTPAPTGGEMFVIDLERTAVMLYNDSSLAPASLLAIGNADATTGAVELLTTTVATAGADELMATANVPMSSGKQHPTFDNSLVIDTTKQEAVLYAGNDFGRPVARGDITNAAGGEVSLMALNQSGLSGKIFLNSVVESTDKYHQFQNMILRGVTVANTDTNGCLYSEVFYDTAANEWTVNIYSDDAGANLVASGIMDKNNGVVNFEDNGSGISGSVIIADPMRGWMPTEQLIGDGGVVIDAGNQHSIMVNQLNGLKNSGMKREENVFTTLNDALTHLGNNDVDALHNMLEQFTTDLARLLNAEATIGVRTNRMTMLEERHKDEIASFTKAYSAAIAVDYTQAAVEQQNAMNIYKAALTVYSDLNRLSLVDYV